MLRKSIKNLLLASSIMMMLASPIMAENEITPARTPICICGGRTIQKVERSSWQNTGKTRRCTHGHEYGLDYEQKRTVTSYYLCTSCGSKKDIRTTAEYRWNCRGVTIPDTGE